MTSTCPPRGVYAPAVAFFTEDESLDLEAFRAHATRLAKAGVAGLVVQGSNGEAPHLLHAERQDLISTASACLKEYGVPGAVVIAGCGAHSTRESIQLCQEAQESGADYALVLTPSYWTGVMNKNVIIKFFDDVANASPIPILLYNFPAVTSGIDLDSDLIATLAAKNSKIVGCKLTCGNLGKLHRVRHDPRAQNMAVFAGKSDFFLHGLVGGSNGVIAAVANLTPKVHIRLLKLYDEGKIQECQELQTLLSQADWTLVQLGVAGLKASLERYYGYGGGRSRRPLGSVDQSAFEGKTDDVLRSLVELENSLQNH